MIILCFIPCVGLFAAIYMWWKFAEKMGKPGPVALCLLVLVLNLLMPYYIVPHVGIQTEPQSGSEPYAARTHFYIQSRRYPFWNEAEISFQVRSGCEAVDHELAANGVNAHHHRNRGSVAVIG